MSKSHIKQLFCNIEGCNNKHYGRGLCKRHYNRIYMVEYYKQYDKQYRQEHKEGELERMRQWRQNNPERYKECSIENNKKYYHDNREGEFRRSTQWYQDNKDYCLKRDRQYRLDNPELIADRAKRYAKTPAGRASKKAVDHNRRVLIHSLTKAIIQRVYEGNIKKYGTLTCYLCDKPITFGEDSLEHSIPLSRGGSNNYENLGIAHFNCNCKKGIKTLEEWNNIKKGMHS